MVVKASMGGMGQHFGDVETGEVDSAIMVNWMPGDVRGDDIDDVEGVADVGQLEAWVEDYAEALGLVGYDDGSGQSCRTRLVWLPFQFCARDGMFAYGQQGC
jgi:hypothetical protein